MCIELLSPKIDFVFKRIFGSEEDTHILISFLNAVIQSEDKIEKVEILNTDVEKEFLDDKFSRLDIRAKTNKNEMINIEIQLRDEYNMVKRSLYYWSKIYTGQLKNKGQYKELGRTICINILDFNLLDNNKYHNIFRLKEVTTGEELTDTMEIHFIELPKLDTNMKIKNILEAWLYFIKQPEKNLEMDIEEIKEAKNKLCKMSSDEKEREKYFIREQSMIQKESALSGAKEAGIKEGMQKGIQQGIKEGVEKKEIDIVSNMLKEGISEDIISKLTKIDISKVIQIKSELQNR